MRSPITPLPSVPRAAVVHSVAPLPTTEPAGDQAAAYPPRARAIVGLGVGGATAGLLVQLFASSAAAGTWQMLPLAYVLVGAALAWGMVVRGSRAARGLFALYALAIVARALRPGSGLEETNAVLLAVQQAGAWLTLAGVALATLSAPAHAFFAQQQARRVSAASASRRIAAGDDA